MTVTETQRAAARSVAATLGVERPSFGRYLDEGEGASIDIVTCVDRPEEGLATASTIGLHLFPNALDGESVPVELLAVTHADVDWLPNLVSTAAFYVMKQGWLAAPGVVFPDVVREYDPDTTVPHLMWFPPFIWPELGTVDLGDGARAHWLMGVPITESERAFLLEHGFDRLEQLFLDNQVAYFDVNRQGLV